MWCQYKVHGAKSGREAAIEAALRSEGGGLCAASNMRTENKAGGARILYTIYLGTSKGTTTKEKKKNIIHIQ